MFESEPILHEFITNLKHSTLLEGYFIGTCYDGQKIFNMLNSHMVDESLSIFKNSNISYYSQLINFINVLNFNILVLVKI